MPDGFDRPQLADRRIPAGDDWLSAEALAALTPDELVRRARALTPVLAAASAEAERLRRPVDSVWQAVRDAGLFYAFVPKAFGGLELDLVSFVEAAVALGEGCASTAWVTAFCMEHNWLLTQFPRQAQDEIFASHPYIIAPGVTAPPGTATPVDGGYRLSGRWGFGTGVMHADWILASALVAGEGPPRSLMFVFPAEAAQVLDTWRVDGMVGTGSNDVQVSDVFVPAHRAVDMVELRAGLGPGASSHDNPLFRIPTFPFQALTAAAPAVGVARASVAAFRERLGGRVILGSAGKQGDKPMAQVRLARADVMTDTAHMLLLQAARRITELGVSGEGADAAVRGKVRAHIAYAVGLCREAIRTVCEGSGAKAHSLDNPLQRAMRDVNVIASHIAFDPDVVFELHGRGLLGLPPNTMIA